MRPTIVFLDEYATAGHDLSPIRALGAYTGYEHTAPEQVVERCRAARIVITNKVRLGAEEMQALPDLRLICVAATGTDHIDTAQAARRGIEVRNAAGYATSSVAEATLGAAIALLRETTYYDHYIKSGTYAASGLRYHFARPTRRLRGRNWGIVGLGTIGRRVADAACAMGCRVAYASVSGIERPEAYPRMELEELLPWADVLSLHCALNERTRGLIGEERLGAMKPGSILINMARGGIVQEDALARALDAGAIAGAALDVFEHEPIEASSPLLRLRDPWRLLLSPHNAWSAEESMHELVACIADNIRDFLAGR